MTQQQELQTIRVRDAQAMLLESTDYCKTLVEMLRLAGFEAPVRPTKTQAAIYAKRIFTMIPAMNGDQFSVGGLSS